MQNMGMCSITELLLIDTYIHRNINRIVTFTIIQSFSFNLVKFATHHVLLYQYLQQIPYAMMQRFDDHVILSVIIIYIHTLYM